MPEDGYPKTLVEFDDRFPSEAACWKYLIEVRWPEGFLCPRCGSAKAWQTERRLLRCSRCHYQASATAGTVFHRTRKPLRTWFRAMWWVSTQKTGGSARGLRRILGLRSQQTAWAWLQKLRRTMIRPGRERLSGTVEVDDAYVGGVEEGVRGRETALKAKIAVAAEVKGRRLGRIRIRHVPDFSQAVLTAFVEQNVEPDSVVRTDGFPGYDPLTGRGYKHRVIVIGSDRTRALRLFPSVHRVISLLKRWLLGTHQGRVTPKHLQRYLDEFTFRFNRRRSLAVGQVFYRLVQQAAATPHESYREIVGPPRTRKSRRSR